MIEGAGAGRQAGRGLLSSHDAMALCLWPFCYGPGAMTLCRSPAIAPTGPSPDRPESRQVTRSESRQARVLAGLESWQAWQARGRQAQWQSRAELDHVLPPTRRSARHVLVVDFGGGGGGGARRRGGRPAAQRSVPHSRNGPREGGRDRQGARRNQEIPSMTGRSRWRSPLRACTLCALEISFQTNGRHARARAQERREGKRRKASEISEREIC